MQLHRSVHCRVTERTRTVRARLTTARSLKIGLASPVDYYLCSDLHVRVFHEDGQRQDSLSFLKQAQGALARVDRVLALTTNDNLQETGAGRTALLIAHQLDGAAAPNSPEERTERAYQQAVGQPSEPAESCAPSTSTSSTSINVDRNLQGSGRNQGSSTRATSSHLSPVLSSGAAFLLPPAAREGVGQCVDDSCMVAVASLDSFGDLMPPRTLNVLRDGAIGCYKREGVAYLSNVAVLPSMRRRGVAQRIVKAAERLAAAWGCRAVGLHCSQQNDAAVQLYTRMGYRPTRALENPILPWLNGRGQAGRCQFFLKRLPSALIAAYAERQDSQPSSAAS